MPKKTHSTKVIVETFPRPWKDMDNHTQRLQVKIKTIKRNVHHSVLQSNYPKCETNKEPYNLQGWGSNKLLLRRSLLN